MNKEQKREILKDIALKEVLNVTETAILTDRSEHNIYELVRNELIPYNKPNGQKKLYFDKSKILAWMRGDQNGNNNTNETNL